MPGLCSHCGKETRSWSSFHGESMCIDCATKLKNAEVIEKAERAESASYFSSWTSKDRTKAFFEILGRYMKNPTQKDIITLHYIYHWAMHDDHALSETIRYTTKWVGIDLYAERQKWIEKVS